VRPSPSLTSAVPMSTLAPTFLPLLQAATDSAGTRIVLEHTWLDTAAGVAQSLVSVLIVVMLVMGVLLLYALKRSIDELGKLIKGAYEPLRLAISEAREVTGEIRAIAAGLKVPAEKAGETLDEASERFRAAMDIAEDRLHRLDALVNIAQEEAEDLVVGAASLVHGVRAGGSVVRRSLGLLGRGRSAAAEEELEDDVDEDVESDDDEVPRPAPRRRSASSRARAGGETADSSSQESPRIRPRAGSPR